MQHLHQGGMGMERVGRTDPLGQGETGEERFGERDLVGFLIDPDLQYRLLAVMGAKGQQLGASCSPLLAPRSVLPSKAMASSGLATNVVWTQAASTRSKLSAHKRGNNQRYKEPTSREKQTQAKHLAQQRLVLAAPLRHGLASIAVTQ